MEKGTTESGIPDILLINRKDFSIKEIKVNFPCNFEKTILIKYTIFFFNSKKFGKTLSKVAQTLPIYLLAQ